MSTLRLITALLFFVILTCSCENEPVLKKGKLEFALESASENARAKSESLRFIVITVQDESGNKVYNRKKIELFKFDDNYLSEPIEFISGQYSLTEFFVLDDAGEVKFATPVEGSKLAHLVSDPLPIHFNITEDQTTKVTPQVISLDEFSAQDFGYTTFSFDVVETISFQLAVFIYNPAIENFQLTTSGVTVTSNGTELYDQSLPDSTTRVVVHDGYEVYHLQITKPGYQSYYHSFAKDSLLQYNSGTVLKVILTPGDGGVLEQGLVGYYPFSGNANDESPAYDNHGSVFGPVLTTDRKGNANSAYYFDGGNDYISIQDNDATDFEATQDFTISLWVSINVPQADPSGAIFDIIRKWDGDLAHGYPYSISYINENASPPNRFLLVRYDGPSCYTVPTLYSPTIVNLTAWHHLVMIKEGSRMKSYLDNQLVADIEDSSSCQTSNNIHITIGSRGQLVRFFNGKIDDIRFYNRALSASEINLLHQE